VLVRTRAVLFHAYVDAPHTLTLTHLLKLKRIPSIWKQQHSTDALQCAEWRRRRRGPMATTHAVKSSGGRVQIGREEGVVNMRMCVNTTWMLLCRDETREPSGSSLSAVGSAQLQAWGHLCLSQAEKDPRARAERNEAGCPDSGPPLHSDTRASRARAAAFGLVHSSAAGPVSSSHTPRHATHLRTGAVISGWRWSQ
jgi:hypothetical protein